jgi:t-SNARE complex subunit (syntaxin)
MKMMDKDDSGEITTDEVADFFKELMMATRDIAKSMNGMRRAARSANAVVCFLLLFVVAIVYGTSLTSLNCCVLSSRSNP